MCLLYCYLDWLSERKQPNDISRVNANKNRFLQVCVLYHSALFLCPVPCMCVEESQLKELMSVYTNAPVLRSWLIIHVLVKKSYRKFHKLQRIKHYRTSTQSFVISGICNAFRKPMVSFNRQGIFMRKSYFLCIVESVDVRVDIWYRSIQQTVNMQH